MATKNKSKSIAAVAAVTLADIVAAGANGLYTSPAVHDALVAEGLVEINPTMTNEAGEIATRATQKAIDTMSNTETKTAAPTAAKSGFVIEDDVAMPTSSGRGRGGNTYPFDDLEVGQSFFVANTEDKPNAAKSLASTVSSATARYAEVIEGQTKTNRKGETVEATRETRKFVVRAVDESDKGRGKGARVWRTA